MDDDDYSTHKVSKNSLLYKVLKNSQLHMQSFKKKKTKGFKLARLPLRSVIGVDQNTGGLNYLTKMAISASSRSLHTEFIALPPGLRSTLASVTSSVQ